MAKMNREFEVPGLEFGAEKGNNGITPHGFEDGMMKISLADPGLIIQGQTAGSGGKMDMEIAFEIAAESMDGGINTWNEIVLSGEVINDFAGYRSQFVEKVAVEPEERLKMSWDGESNVLPSRVRERIKSGFDPIISILFAAGGTEARFAGMRCLDLAETFWADKDMPAKQRSPAGKHLEHVDDNGLANQLAVGEEEFPPVAVIKKDVPDFDFTADEFHKGNIVKLIVDER